MRITIVSIFTFLMMSSSLSSQDLEIRCPSSEELSRASLAADFPDFTYEEIINSYFEDWKGSFFYQHSDLSCEVSTTDVSGFTIPPLTGGSVTIDYRATDNCGNDESCSATFTIIGDPTTTIILNCPEDLVLEDCSSQAKVDSAFNAWKSQFTFIAPAGSDLVATDLSIESPPNCGSSKTITFIVEDRSNPLIAPVECSRTFVLPPAPLINPLEGIPTVGEWGVIALVLILLSIAVVSLKSRSTAAA